MTARATIFGEDSKNPLVVPLTAVRTDKQGEYVYVIKDGQPGQCTAVSTGVTGDTNVQILKGLSEGDEIIVSGDVTAPKNNSLWTILMVGEYESSSNRYEGLRRPISQMVNYRCLFCMVSIYRSIKANSYLLWVPSGSGKVYPLP